MPTPPARSFPLFTKRVRSIVAYKWEFNSWLLGKLNDDLAKEFLYLTLARVPFSRGFNSDFRSVNSVPKWDPGLHCHPDVLQACGNWDVVKATKINELEP